MIDSVVDGDGDCDLINFITLCQCVKRWSLFDVAEAWGQKGSDEQRADRTSDV